MATIPVQPVKRGVPTWLWLLLGLIVLALIAFFLIGNDDDADDDYASGDTTRVVRPAPGPSLIPLTSLDSLSIAGASFNGRRVDMDGAEVSRVVSDSAFYVRSSTGRDVLVVLDEPAGVSTAGTASGFSVAQGDVVRLRGQIREAAGDMMGVPEGARSSLRAGAAYVAASANDVIRSGAIGVDDPMMSDGPMMEGDAGMADPEEMEAPPAPMQDSTATDTTTTL